MCNSCFSALLDCKVSVKVVKEWTCKCEDEEHEVTCIGDTNCTLKVEWPLRCAHTCDHADVCCNSGEPPTLAVPATSSGLTSAIITVL